MNEYVLGYFAIRVHFRTVCACFVLEQNNF